MNETINVQAAIPEAVEESEVPSDNLQESTKIEPDPVRDAEEALPAEEALCDAVSEADDSDQLADLPIDGEARADRLERELASLRAELEARDARDARILEEYKEFRALYPDVSPDTLSDKVLSDLQRGIPLAAAYALDQRRLLLLTKKAEESNAENRHRSSGAATGTENLYFSPAEVRAMSQAEVKKNYHLIIESMKSWH